MSNLSQCGWAQQEERRREHDMARAGHSYKPVTRITARVRIKDIAVDMHQFGIWTGDGWLLYPNAWHEMRQLERGGLHECPYRKDVKSRW
jgi:hypothetical protein